MLTTRSEAPVWMDVLNQAQAYDYGLGDTIRDTDRARALYKQAARLGAAEAYVRLSEMLDYDEAQRWLTRGAKAV